MDLLAGHYYLAYVNNFEQMLFRFHPERCELDHPEPTHDENCINGETAEDIAAIYIDDGIGNGWDHPHVCIDEISAADVPQYIGTPDGFYHIVDGFFHAIVEIIDNQWRKIAQNDFPYQLENWPQQPWPIHLDKTKIDRKNLLFHYCNDINFCIKTKRFKEILDEDYPKTRSDYKHNIYSQGELSINFRPIFRPKYLQKRQTSFRRFLSARQNNNPIDL